LDAKRLTLLALGVVATLLLTFLLLAVVNMVTEALFYSSSDDGGPAFADPDAPGVPVTGLRLGFAVTLVVLYPFVFGSHRSETLKAILLSAPVATAAAAIGVSLYDRPVAATLGMLGVAIVTGVFVWAARLPWQFRASAVIALVLAAAYAWPSF
jgi:hypothetical protein